jgi:hypothetical protein
MKSEAPAGSTTQDRAQLFWRTATLKEGEGTQVSFPVTSDGQWHEYRVDVASSPRWRGRIRHLRLDPCMRSGVRFAIDFIRLEP